MEDELKCCPFCGSVANVINQKINKTNTPYWIVECENNHCYSRTRVCYDGAEEAIKLWNQRV